MAKTITAEQERDFEQAHDEGEHEIPREGCALCERRTTRAERDAAFDEERARA